MKEFKVSMLLQELKKAYAERVVRNGFDDSKLYNDELLKLDDVDLEEFEKLKKAVGSSVAGSGVQDIEINSEGFNKEEYEKIEKIQKKPKKELTEEEKKLLQELKKKKENRNKAIAILRAISIRMPLLVYGMAGDIDTEITIENFVDLVDDLSWEEFMPKDVNKEMFKKFIKYYDKDIFIACARRIRYISKTADELEPTERVLKISQLFSTFKNPDKETVLTPWKVVNMHMSRTLGGYCFYDESFEKEIEVPRFIDVELTTEKTLKNTNSNILEINSKTGLYPLYIVYSLYRCVCDSIGKEHLTFEEKINAWDYVVSNCVYVICKTPMAKSITKRTLIGYRKGKINAHAFDDLINQMKEKQAQLVQKVKSPSFWNKGGKEMKFNAVVGNPPYQGVNHQQIYPNFYLTSQKLGDIVSLIFPVGWQQPKSANNLGCINKKEIKEDKQIVYIDNRQNVFPGISGAEWVNIILWIKGYDNQLDGEQLVYTNGENPKQIKILYEAQEIQKPVEIVELAKIVMNSSGFVSLQSRTSVRKPYGLSTDVFKDYSKYNLQPFFDTKVNDNDIVVIAVHPWNEYFPILETVDSNESVCNTLLTEYHG